MGQYYKPALIVPDNRVLTMRATSFDSFNKLTEHSWISNPFVNAVYSLIYKSAKRVAWIGDYSREDYETCGEAYIKAMPFDQFQKFYELTWGDDVIDLPSKFFSNRDLSILTFDTKGMFLVNRNKRVYIDMAAYIRENTVKSGAWAGWCMDPLPLLTACGNGRGGGDFYEGHIGYADIGVWAFDCLEYTDQIPDGYTEAMYYFDEHREATA